MVVKDSRLALASKAENKEEKIKKENINFILDLTKYQEAQSTRRYQKRKLRMKKKSFWNSQIRISISILLA